jgi:DnaJ-class molecular chaperone
MEKCKACNGRGFIPGAKNRKYIRGVGIRTVPIRCTPCRGTGRVGAR